MPRRPPYVAYLRVFEPVAHLAPAVREQWTSYAQSSPQRGLIEAAQFAESVRWLVGRPPPAPASSVSADGLVLEVGGELYACPSQQLLRVWRQLAAADEELPDVLAATLPPVLREQAAADLAAYLREGGETRLFTRAASWHVPVAWFVPFAAPERTLELGAGERSLRYRTTMASARRRAARGLRTAREHVHDTDVVAEIEQVARWLEQFDHRSLVELDYAALVDLLDDVHLRGDDSAADVASGLAGLAEGDALSAAAAYRRWTTRWQRVALIARAS